MSKDYVPKEGERVSIWGDTEDGRPRWEPAVVLSVHPQGGGLTVRAEQDGVVLLVLHRRHWRPMGVGVRNRHPIRSAGASEDRSGPKG